MEEIWRDIDGYEGYYQVSNLGRIRSVDRYISSQKFSNRLVRGKIICYEYNSNNYKRVGLFKNGKRDRRFVHRLVIENHSFKNDSMCINHKDGDKSNNHINNLEYTSRSENLAHAYDTKLRRKSFSVTTKEIVKFILNSKETLSTEDVMDKFSCSKSTAYRYLKRSN